jgi:hypothetical protein
MANGTMQRPYPYLQDFHSAEKAGKTGCTAIGDSQYFLRRVLSTKGDTCLSLRNTASCGKMTGRVPLIAKMTKTQKVVG